jgi:hypothetical protein
VFLGYSSLCKGEKCLHVPSNCVCISCDVIFYENFFPFSVLIISITTPTPSLHLFHSFSDKFEDSAYSSRLLPNHGTGVRIRSHFMDIDHECMGHARGHNLSSSAGH